MPRGLVRNRWLVPGLACTVILAGVAWSGVRWIKGDRQRGALEQGRAAYEQRDWPAAERLALEQLRTDREDPRTRRLLGRALYRQGRDHAAAAIFERLGRDTMEAEDYLLVGQACLRDRKIDLAIKIWEKAVQLDPNHFESRIALEQVCFRLDKLSQAEQQAESLLAQPGRDALAELLRGQIRTQQSDPAGAARAFELALERPDQWTFLVQPGLPAQATGSLPAPDGPTRPGTRAVAAVDRLGPRSGSLLAACPMRPAGSDPDRSGCLGPGACLSTVAPDGARAGGVRRRIALCRLPFADLP